MPSTNSVELCQPSNARSSACIAAIGAAVALCSSAASFAQQATAGAAVLELQEVVVTATRREESLSKIPVSVSAFTQDKIDNIGAKSIADIARFTPGVTFGTNQTNDIAIRGISSSAGAGTTGIYIDDTPIQIRSLGGFNNDDALPAVFDLERVEVLRGPQGTLFGAGSEGGTVRYITPQPSLTKSSMYARSEVSTTKYGEASYEAGLAGGAPLIEDKLGFRASVWYRHNGGWIDRFDTATNSIVDRNINRYGTLQARLSFAWAPTSNILITPSFTFQDQKSHDVATYNSTISDPRNGRFLSTNPSPRPTPDQFYIPALKMEFSFDKVKLISNTSYFDRKEIGGYEGTIYNLSFYQTLSGFNPIYSPMLTPLGPNYPAGFANYRSPATVTNRQANITQELRLQSNETDAVFNWTIGAFFSVNRQVSIEEIHDPMNRALFLQVFGMTEEAYWGVPLLANGDSYMNDLVSHDRQVAGFGELSYNITDRLKLIAGARYSKTSFNFNGHSDGPQNGGPVYSHGSQSEKPFTPKLGLDFQIDPNNLVYATWAKGFRIGGANPPLPVGAHCATVAPAAYNSDSVKSYEVGAKNKFFDKVRIASSAYYIEWTNIQQLFIDPACQIGYIANLGQAAVKGFDLQTDIAITDQLVAETAVGWNNARYAKDVGDPAVRRVSNGDTIGGSPWTAALGLQYNFVAFQKDSFARIDYEYSSKNNYLRPDQNPQNPGQFNPFAFTLPKTEFVSFRAGTSVADWTIAAFVDNVFNKQTTTEFLRTQGKDPTLIQFDQGGFRPRTFGVTLTFRK